MARFRWWRVRRWVYLNRGEIFGFSMAILALLLAALYATGCGTQPVQSIPNHANVPIKDIAVPRVEIVGDDIAQGLVAYAANERWACSDCAQGATSTIAFSNFSLALGTRPDVILFVIGTYDLVPVPGQPPWFISCGDQDITCNNLTGMIAQGQAAGIQVIVGTIPPWGIGPLSSNLDPTTAVPALLPKWNQHLLTSYGKGSLVASGTAIPVIDFNTALAQQANGINGPYIASYTNNGVDPNSAGYTIMVQLIQKQLGTMKFTVK